MTAGKRLPPVGRGVVRWARRPLGRVAAGPRGRILGWMDRAYVTLVSHGNDYVPGAEALARSLDTTGTTVPRVVMVTDDVPAEARRSLQAHGWLLREVGPIPSPAADELFPRFRHVFTKLRLWELAEIGKAVFLDADTIVLRNIDELFDRPGFAAAPDFLMPDQFNSGVMVANPSGEAFGRLMDALEQAESYDGGDQGLLNRFHGDWFTGSADQRLAAGYNTHHFIYQFICSHPTLRRQLEPRVKVVHYTVQKPWQDRPLPTFTGGAQTWWQVYFDGHPEQDRPWKRRLRALQDLAFDRVVGLVAR